MVKDGELEARKGMNKSLFGLFLTSHSSMFFFSFCVRVSAVKKKKIKQE